MARSDAKLNAVKCNRTYTRFTTPGMSAILPDIPNAPSGWNTDNHYFYELMNRNGKDAFIQLAIGSQNITPEFREICDRINELYPAKMGKEDWQWRIPFRTSSIPIDEDLSKTVMFARLDSLIDEIHSFEADLSAKFKN